MLCWRNQLPGRQKSINDDNDQFCIADQIKCKKGAVYPWRWRTILLCWRSRECRAGKVYPWRSLRRNFVVQMISNERHSQVFINEMIMRCEKYQILIGHSPLLTIIIIIRSKRWNARKKRSILDFKKKYAVEKTEWNDRKPQFTSDNDEQRCSRSGRYEMPAKHSLFLIMTNNYKFQMITTARKAQSPWWWRTIMRCRGNQMPRRQSLPLLKKDNCAFDPEDMKCEKGIDYSW